MVSFLAHCLIKQLKDSISFKFLLDDILEDLDVVTLLFVGQSL